MNRHDFIDEDKAAERRVRLFVAVTRVVAARERCQIASLRNVDFYARVFISLHRTALRGYYVTEVCEPGGTPTDLSVSGLFIVFYGDG